MFSLNDIFSILIKSYDEKGSVHAYDYKTKNEAEVKGEKIRSLENEKKEGKKVKGERKKK